MSRTVVIALDHSDLSARALPLAESIARQWRGHLVLVHAVDRGEHSRGPRERDLAEVIRQLSDAGIQADAVVSQAPPAQAIVDIAHERRADLIVMASHQRAGLNRWLNGSVTEEVLTRTAIPLMVIPAVGESAFPSSVRALVPLDGTRSGEAPLEFLHARSTNRPLELVLVRFVSNNPVVIGVDPMYTLEPLSVADYEAELQGARGYLNGLAATLGDAHTSARYRAIETTQPIAQAILDTARRQQVDLIAIGTHAKAGMPRMVLGSVSEEVLEHSTVPVLLVRQKTADGSGEAGPIDKFAMAESG